MVQEITPKYDSTLGLIFRLNALWAEADMHAKNGDYDQWNNILDRLYCNLSYREEITIEKDGGGNIINIKLLEKDKKVYNYLSLKISKFKSISKRIKGVTKKGTPKRKIAKSLWFKSLMLKDIWLRKYMNTLNLYIKETTRTPGSVMFGKK